MLVIAGLSLRNLQPRVWDPVSPFYLPNLQAVMVSYAEFARNSRLRRVAMEAGLHDLLGVPRHLHIYLDNGAFSLMGAADHTARDAYEEFVAAARPDWYPIPRDFIPTPWMTPEEQRACLARTMAVNLAYRHDGFVPVMHCGRLTSAYLQAFLADDQLRGKPVIALGGLVPNLLRTRQAQPYPEILQALRLVRDTFRDKSIHVFGVGGTATLHLMALLDIDSLDSSGWRNRAARGIIQLPGSGDRLATKMGSWRGREPNPSEWQQLAECPCPACRSHGLDGLRASKLEGFCNRATHNLWVLLRESEQVRTHLAAGTYPVWFGQHLNNSNYLPLIRWALDTREARQSPLVPADRVAKDSLPRVSGR